MINDQQRENLNILANILQIYNTMLLQADASNNDLMQEIHKQNDEIIKRLEKIEKKLDIKQP